MEHVLKRKRYPLMLGGLALAVVVVTGGVRLAAVGDRSAQAPVQGPGAATAASPASRRSRHKSVQNPVSVMTIGGSVAHGWNDTKQGGGYLVRAFRALSARTNIPYHIVDRTVVGSNALQVATQYPVWLKTVHPQVVVISWGGLNDAWPRTPFSRYEAEVNREIHLALASHASVLVVTPPVTRASYTQYRVAEPLYLDREMNAALQFHSSSVHVFDVFDQMKAYLKAHHQTYVPYMSNGWHPNSRGHILAGHILYHDMRAAFGLSPI
ncbi:MAG: SGNH/GDSL hydrolase family protein [Bacilli bacterium]